MVPYHSYENGHPALIICKGKPVSSNAVRWSGVVDLDLTLLSTRCIRPTPLDGPKGSHISMENTISCYGVNLLYLFGELVK